MFSCQIVKPVVYITVRDYKENNLPFPKILSGVTQLVKKSPFINPKGFENP